MIILLLSPVSGGLLGIVHSNDITRNKDDDRRLFLLSDMLIIKSD